MGKRNEHIISDELGKAHEEICEKIYQDSIADVYDFGNKLKMPYTDCKGCEASTPTIVTRAFDTCALCGQAKEIQEVYE